MVFFSLQLPCQRRSSYVHIMILNGIVILMIVSLPLDLAYTFFKILLWLESLLWELTIPFLPPSILCDNLSAVLWSHNPIINAHIKHIELDINFLPECVISKKMKIQYVPSSLQLADTLTKPLIATIFQDLRTKLKVLTFVPHWDFGGVLEEVVACTLRYLVLHNIWRMKMMLTSS